MPYIPTRSPWQPGQVVWKRPGAGFCGDGGYGQIPQTAEYEPGACALNCGNDDCGEWSDLWMLHGRTRPEAMIGLVAGYYAGLAFHVSDCELSLAYEGVPSDIPEDRRYQFLPIAIESEDGSPLHGRGAHIHRWVAAYQELGGQGGR